MKWHDCIRNKTSVHPQQRIYHTGLAQSLFDDGIYTARELSLMKQENIRMALIDGSFCYDDIPYNSSCGYCFEVNQIDIDGCKPCRLVTGRFSDCCESEMYWAMARSKNLKDFAHYHKNWCIEMGIWKGDWE